jgi:GntR family transcriptional regulator
MGGMMQEPMYRQIADDLRQKIESGDLGRDGHPLPTELELREQYGASRNTVRDAVKWLITRGLVETRPGQGTFVVQKIDPFVTPLRFDSGFGDEGTTVYAKEVAARLRKPEVSVPRIEIQRASGVVASELSLPDGTNVVSRHQQRLIDDIPWSLQTSFYPMRFVELGATNLLQAQDMPTGTVRYLQEALGIKQVGWRDKITVRAPDMVESAFFKLPDDGRVAVFEIRRTAFDQAGRPIRLTVTTYPADRNQFVVEIGDVPRVAEPSAGPASAGDVAAEAVPRGGPASTA